MHVVHARGAGFLVQIVHVLRAQKKAVPHRTPQSRKGSVRGVWFAADGLGTTLGVEAPNGLRVCGPALG